MSGTKTCSWDELLHNDNVMHVQTIILLKVEIPHHKFIYYKLVLCRCYHFIFNTDSHPKANQRVRVLDAFQLDYIQVKNKMK